MLICGTHLTLKQIILTECRKYETQRSKNNIPDKQREILGLEERLEEATDKIV